MYKRWYNFADYVGDLGDAKSETLAGLPNDVPFLYSEHFQVIYYTDHIVDKSKSRCPLLVHKIISNKKT